MPDIDKLLHLAQRSSLVVLLSGPLFFLLILSLPRPVDMTLEGHRVAAVAVWMSIWWLSGIIPIGATALLPFVLFPFLGVIEGSQAILSFAHWMNFLLLGGFFLAAAMEKWGLHRRMALAIIDFIGVTPRRIILGFMVSTAFISMWISNTAACLIMLPVATAVMMKFRELTDESVHSNMAPCIMLSIAYASSIGGVGTIIGTGPNAIFVSQVSSFYDLQVTFFDWLKVGLPMVIIILPLAWLYMVRYQFPLPSVVSGENITVIREERIKMGSMKRGEKIVAVVFLLTALGWTFRANIDLGIVKIPGIVSYLPFVDSDATIAMMAAVLLFAIPIDRSCKQFTLDLQSAMKIPWDVLLIIGGGVLLAKGFESSHLSVWVADQLRFFDFLHPFMVLFICVALVTFFTELTSNTATSTIFMPIMGSFAIAIGQNPLFLMIPCVIAVSMAFMLPVATPPNAVVYGSGMISAQQMARAGFLLNWITIISITLTTLFLLIPLLGIETDVIPAWATLE